jgi:hypothetical protein
MNTPGAVERWRGRSPMTDPGARARLLSELPSDVAELSRIVGNLLIHGECLPQYGLRESDFPAISRETLPVATRLAQVHGRDDRSLLLPRDPVKRSIATCRDYAVMLCAMLRAQGIAARVRCGFASYLDPGRWADHWVCERWLAEDRRWAAADAQMDAVLRKELKIAFDHVDLPRTAFISAGEAWLRCRSGALDPAYCGHGEAAGLWFVYVNVVRDHLALNHVETSDWDSWRKCSPGARHVQQNALAWIDEIARRPEIELITIPQPPWL